MDTMPDAYWRQIHGRFGRLPVWLPGTPMELGDVGTFPSSRWTKFTTLDALGVTTKHEPEGTTGDIEYFSHKGVQKSAGLARSGIDTAAVSAVGDIHYRFARKGAFVLHTRDATVHRLAGLAAVQESVLALYRAEKWRREWVVITEVLVGGPSLVLVSAGQTAEASVRLLAQTILDPVASVAVAPSFTVASQQGLAASLDTAARAPLMWRGYRVRDPLFGEPRFAERGEDKTVTPEPYPLSWEEIAYPGDLETSQDAT